MGKREGRDGKIGEENSGRFVYCVARSSDKRDVSLGKKGIDGAEVYGIPSNGLCALVHDCPEEPYKSDDLETVKTWVLAHQSVVEAASERFGTVVPFSFNTIIKNGSAGVKGWLESYFEMLSRKLASLEGKLEFGVQLFLDREAAASELLAGVKEIGELSEKINAAKGGTAYLYKQKLDKMVKDEIEKKAGELFSSLYDRIKRHAVSIKTGKPGDGMIMVANFSCLVEKEKVRELGEELDRFKKESGKGLSIRFTGPWPPYGFA